LEIVELKPQQVGGYLPADGGALTQYGPTTWRYYSFDEPITAICARTVEVWIAAKRGSTEYARKRILVHSVHAFLTTGANADFQRDSFYLRWKYAAVLATTGGGFSSEVISTDTCVNCPWWNPLRCVYACTDIENGSVVFGTNTFSGSENQAASIIGHELVHTTGADECQAYTWEFNHVTGTGVFQCDTSYLANVVQMMNCKCSEINCPE
jgi:hypothetical protein